MASKTNCTCNGNVEFERLEHLPNGNWIKVFKCKNCGKVRKENCNRDDEDIYNG